MYSGRMRFITAMRSHIKISGSHIHLTISHFNLIFSEYNLEEVCFPLHKKCGNKGTTKQKEFISKLFSEIMDVRHVLKIARSSYQHWKVWIWIWQNQARKPYGWTLAFSTHPPARICGQEIFESLHKQHGKDNTNGIFIGCLYFFTTTDRILFDADLCTSLEGVWNDITIHRDAFYKPTG